MTRIAVDGLRPRRGHSALFHHGSYGSHGQGKLFLAQGLGAAREWLCRVENMGQNISDDVQDHVSVLLRVRPCSEPVIDPVGDADVTGSYYVTRKIPACRIEFWHPQKEWTPVRFWSDNLLPFGVREVEGNINIRDWSDEGKDLIIAAIQAGAVPHIASDDDAAFWTYECYDEGGFKPPRE